MMAKRQKYGRVNAPWEVIERFAAHEIATMALAKLDDQWTLTRHSAFHRCKNGTFTLRLVWHGSKKGRTMSSTIRGLRFGP
ncbi:MAG: hypothetical protein DI629_03540 [Mesorhizobium amorphae]|nr:MAG: hypothetical protein DI629_03540 [Mesorhizobium amorphae]